MTTASEDPGRGGGPLGSPRRVRSLAGGVAFTLVLAGCSLQGDRQVAVLAPDASPETARGTPPPRVKTVKPTALSAADDLGEPVGATPAPKQIFDFHPPGSRADAWRQPFVIDPNDGPLAADVRKTAAELRAYLAAPKGVAPPRVAMPRRCGETDVATARPGCVGAGVAATPAAVPKPTAAN